MRHRYLLLLLPALAGMLLASALGLMPGTGQARADSFHTTPHTNQGKPWRIGYLEGGPYFNYNRNLRALVRGFMELGWLASMDLPGAETDEDTADLWSYLAEHAKGPYIEFVSDAWYSEGWSDEARPVVRDQVIKRLNRGDLDLVIAAGTWAGQDLATDQHHVPVIVFSVSDAVEAGIVVSPTKARYPHVHAKCDPDRYVRMVRLFYNLFQFQRLGITYEDSPEGRTYSAVDDMEQVAREFGFEVVHCQAPFTTDKDAAMAAVADCQKKLARSADAVMIPVHRGVQPESMPMIVAPLLEHNIPTMTLHGSLEVRYGALMGFTLGEGAFRRIGLFHARVAASIFNGAVPGELPLIFEDPRQLAVNLETARIIGWTPPPGLLSVADEIYQAIEVPDGAVNP